MLGITFCAEASEGDVCTLVAYGMTYGRNVVWSWYDMCGKRTRVSRLCERGDNIPVAVSWVIGLSGVKKTVMLIPAVCTYCPLLLLVIIIHHNSICYWRNSVLIIFSWKTTYLNPPWPAGKCISHFILYFQTYNQLHLQLGVQNVTCLSVREYLR
jgi:hypothetical protein